MACNFTKSEKSCLLTDTCVELCVKWKLLVCILYKVSQAQGITKNQAEHKHIDLLPSTARTSPLKQQHSTLFLIVETKSGQKKKKKKNIFLPWQTYSANNTTFLLLFHLHHHHYHHNHCNHYHALRFCQVYYVSTKGRAHIFVHQWVRSLNLACAL